MNIMNLGRGTSPNSLDSLSLVPYPFVLGTKNRTHEGEGVGRKMATNDNRSRWSLNGIE